MRKITFKDILKQLKYDLIGKDSHRGITLTYAWLANQFGHTTLGFIPAYLLHFFLNFKNPITASLIVVGFWFLFELYNFLGPLLLRKVSRAKNIYIPNNKSNYVFNPSWKNIAFDTFTDICFFALGALLFSLLVKSERFLLIILIILILYLMIASRYWFLTKMYQHHANFPFQFRLSQWEYTISEEDKKKIEEYVAETSDGNHLLIFGSQLCGKTSLGVGVLNELAIKHYSCLYTSAMKLYAYFFIDADFNTGRQKLWNWKYAKYLIIDDVNPGHPIKDELVTPETFLKFLDPTSVGIMSEESTKLIANKNVIWILGSFNVKEDSRDNKWVQMLCQIGVDFEKIRVVNL